MLNPGNGWMLLASSFWSLMLTFHYTGTMNCAALEATVITACDLGTRVSIYILHLVILADAFIQRDLRVGPHCEQLGV